MGKFVVMKNCFQIPVDWEIDRKLVKDLVQARLAELTSGHRILNEGVRFSAIQLAGVTLSLGPGFMLFKLTFWLSP
jgi:hypothetical protein